MWIEALTASRNEEVVAALRERTSRTVEGGSVITMINAQEGATTNV